MLHLARRRKNEKKKGEEEEGGRFQPPLATNTPCSILVLHPRVDLIRRYRFCAPIINVCLGTTPPFFKTTYRRVAFRTLSSGTYKYSHDTAPAL